jgi:hypothetical protein
MIAHFSYDCGVVICERLGTVYTARVSVQRESVYTARVSAQRESQCIQRESVYRARVSVYSESQICDFGCSIVIAVSLYSIL